MASDRDEKKNIAQSNSLAEVPGVPQGSVDATEAPAPIAKALGPARIFRDNVFTSRTLIMPDGRALAVNKGRVKALGDDQFEFLKSHPDLELLPE